MQWAVVRNESFFPPVLFLVDHMCGKGVSNPRNGDGLRQLDSE